MTGGQQGPHSNCQTRSIKHLQLHETSLIIAFSSMLVEHCRVMVALRRLQALHCLHGDNTQLVTAALALSRCPESVAMQRRCCLNRKKQLVLLVSGQTRAILR